jgi:hypothetical protein
MATKVVTPEARLSFPDLFVARPPMEGSPGEPKFGCTLLFPKEGCDLAPLKALVKEAIAAKWGATPPKGLKLPFRDGDEKDLDGYAGMIYIRATGKTKPGVVDSSVQPILDPEEIYAGCYVRASLNAYAYEKAGNRGVSFGLNNIQKTREGERFGGAKAKPEDDFQAVATSGKAPARNAAESLDDIL